MGIKKDIHLVKDDYQWLGSMFYFGTLRLFEEQYHVLIRSRISGMGISNKQIAAVLTPCQILVFLHNHVGSCALLYGGLQELLRGDRCSILLGCV